MKRFATFGLACFFMFTIAGCGDSAPGLVPVSGQVLIDGQPVRDAAVQVLPEGGRAAFGRTDEDGRFRLMTYRECDGCLTGTHRVVVVAVSSTGPDEETLHVPPKYMEPEQTDLSIDVAGPTDDLVLQLTWGDQRGPITRKIDPE
jgi:hypothetical protein